jgi:hypothetical protein
MFTRDVIAVPKHWPVLAFAVIMFALDVLNRDHVRDHPPLPSEEDMVAADGLPHPGRGGAPLQPSR